MPLSHNLTTAQTQTAQGDYSGAWRYLAELGDSYADNAADVTGQPDSVFGLAMKILVKEHLDSTAGEGAYDVYFLHSVNRASAARDI